jgi:small GTP-binding protein
VSRRKKIFKITLLGEGAVGKTAIKSRYLGDTFKKNYTITIGADFAVKRMNVNNEEVTLQIWDLAGQPRFSKVREVYYNGTTGALLIYDISRRDTFEKVAQWIGELIKNNQNRIVPVILIANKSDLRGTEQEKVSEEEGLNYAAELANWAGFDIPYVETSALSGDNVEDAFIRLVENIEMVMSSRRTA